MATDRVPDWVGGWASVYDHNRGMMEKFVGDLGEGEFGAFGSRPGGFIGEVMDGLDMNNPAHRELATRMQEQADLVRSMFTHEDFKRGNGDPAKMGRHILALQGMCRGGAGDRQCRRPRRHHVQGLQETTRTAAASPTPS